jgi:hypothetical protein
MHHGLMSFGLAVSLLTCSACGTDDGVAPMNGTAFSDEGKVAGGVKGSSTKTTGLPAAAEHEFAEQALRFPDPGDGPWKKWLVYSESEEGEEKSKIYRIPGDVYSRYYTIDVDMSDGDQYTDIRNDKGKNIGGFGDYANYVGIRKIKKSIIVFFYYSPTNDDLGEYHIVIIEEGRQKGQFRCFVGKRTLEMVAGEHFETRKQLMEARFKYATDVVNLLTSAGPVVDRDRCI